jgi:hypothetical protein
MTKGINEHTSAIHALYVLDGLNMFSFNKLPEILKRGKRTLKNSSYSEANKAIFF